MQQQQHDQVIQHESADVAQPLGCARLLRRLAAFEWIHENKNAIRQTDNALDLFGYLNPLRASQIQIVTPDELAWVEAQPPSALAAAPPFKPEIAELILLDDACENFTALAEVCRKNDIALAQVPQSGDEISAFLQRELPRSLAPKQTVHGVFLAIKNTGVLITGASGIGKSEVALDLVQRGHQLVADDVVKLHRNDDDELVGECPPMLRGLLEIRGLGIISLLKMFGPSAILDRYRLQLIVNMRAAGGGEIHRLDRLRINLKFRRLLGADIPCLTILIAPGRNLAVLIEAAVRDHLLRSDGSDSSLEFIDQHEKHLLVAANEKV